MARSEKNVRHLVGDDVAQNSVCAIPIDREFIDSVIEHIQLASRLALHADLGKA
jgi:hypothetical protein